MHADGQTTHGKSGGNADLSAMQPKRSDDLQGVVTQRVVTVAYSSRACNFSIQYETKTVTCAKTD